MVLSSPASPASSSSPSPSEGAAPSGPPALVLPRSVAARYVRNLIDKGVAIRRLRVRYVEDLEDVRARKAEWVAQYTDVLRQLFTTGAIADACNDWVGRVYPEYADTTLFVEQFYQEMDHRCRRLRGVLKQIGEMADPVIPVRNDAAAASQPAPVDDAGTGAGASGQPAATPDASSPTSPFPPAAAAAEPPSPPALVSGILVAPAGRPELARAADAVATFLDELGVSLIRVPAPAGNAPATPSPAAYEEGPDASFALLLLTPEEAQSLRAPAADAPPACRADTAFQLGYFVGRLGARRVCALVPGGEPGTEPHGVACLPLDPSAGWQLHLARHLRRAGIDIDLNRLC